MNEGPLPSDDVPGPVVEPRRRAWVPVALSFLILAAGFVAGMSTTGLLVARRPPFRVRDPQRGAQMFADRLRDELDLTDDQTERVAAVVTQHQERLVALQREIGPKMEAAHREFSDQVAEVLDDEQRRRWQERVEELKARWGGRGPGPGPPRHRPFGKPRGEAETE